MTESLSVAFLQEAARAIIQRTRYCFLVTLDEVGRPNARLMQHFEPEDDLTLWLGTSAASHKVAHILADDRVLIADEDPDDPAYVTLLGTARIVRDPALQRQYWVDEYLESFPAGPESEDYVLIRVTPSRIELMSYARHITPSPYGLRPAVLVREGDSWEVEEVKMAKDGKKGKKDKTKKGKGKGKGGKKGK